MSCQSLAPARAFPASPQQPSTPCTGRHRSVRFSSESQTSFRRSSNETECKRETPGSVSLTTLAAGVSSNPRSTFSMSRSAPSGSVNFGDTSGVVAPPLPSSACRFPKLEECAHFHYERVGLGGLRVQMVRGDASSSHEDSPGGSQAAEGWVCLRVRSHVNDAGSVDVAGESGHSASWTSAAQVAEWSLTRNADNFKMLDNMLHRCIYDRKVSGLSDLSRELTAAVIEDVPAYESLVEDYLHHLSIIADDSINCGPVLNWLQIDNRGHRLLVANEDSSSINTPAVAAAYSVRKYISQARDEISFEVGDMISIIDMPGPQESLWWRGKRGFKVGFFPHHCVAVIGDKVPRHMTQPPPIVGSVAMAPIKPVLRKHGKLISLFRSFILSRPSRRTLKQQGILRERVFGCDLGEHLLNTSHDVPVVLIECARVIETHGAVDGIYRLSGGSGLTQRLRAAFDEGRAPDLAAPPVLQDIHAVASLLKMYFRELPNPLCTYQLYAGFVDAVQPGPEDPTRLRRMRETVVKLPPPHYRTLSYLMRHLRRVSLLGAATGMTARNMAIVWAPNLLRSPHSQHALQGVAVQAVVTEFLICYAEDLFSEEQGDSGPASLEVDVELRHGDSARRPKSLPLNAPTKLLSLEEARQRGGLAVCPPGVTALMPPPSGAIAAAANTQLRPSSHKEPQYIEVGSGPHNLPQYHTVIELPAPGAAKRGLKRSPSGWRGLFSLRSKQQRQPCADTVSVERPAPAAPAPEHDLQPNEATDSPLWPVKSCESLHSESEQLAPLSGFGSAQIGKQHARSASCDSYFEPWQAELADMRLRLSPQERDGNMFSEEDDATHAPATSAECSFEPSPMRTARAPPPDADVDAWDRKRSKLEEQLSSIGYIDASDPPRQMPSPEKRHSDEWGAPVSQADVAKRLCKDRDSPHSLQPPDTFLASSPVVKLRERSSPRKNRGSVRYSGLHQPLANLPAENDAKIVTIVNQIGRNRLTWHGAKDSHSTLIKIDWPVETNSLTPSTLMTSPLTPITPNYDALESDSDVSENKQTYKVECTSCDRNKKCLKCELSDASGYDTGNVEIQKVVEAKREVSIFDRLEVDERRDFGRVAADKRDSDTFNKREKSHRDSLESSPVTSTNVSYQNLNRLSNISTNSSNSDPIAKEAYPYENVSVAQRIPKSVMTSSHESTSSYSNVSPKPVDELYECFSFSRPNYINLQSSGSSKSTSPLKSPLRSTISITFKSPTKALNDYEVEIQQNKIDRDSVYEDVDLEKNLSIVEEAAVPECNACLPTQQAAEPGSFAEDLIILESPTNDADGKNNSLDVYSQVKFFRKSIEEVNAMILESPPSEVENFNRHYENVDFTTKDLSYGKITLKTDEETIDSVDPEMCIDRRVLSNDIKAPEEPMLQNFNKMNFDSVYSVQIQPMELENLTVQPRLSLPIEAENVNYSNNKTMNLNVRQLANKFESPTEQKGPFIFDKPYREVKYPTLDRKKELDRARSYCESKPKKELTLKIPPPVSPKTYKLSKNSAIARSLDENAFVKEFGRSSGERRKSFEIREMKIAKFQPDLNLNTEEIESESFDATTSESKMCLVQQSYTLPKSPTKSLNFDTEKKLSRERIEKYKEERRNFLREKYATQSFRTGNTEGKLRKREESEKSEPPIEKNERLSAELPKFERRNTVDMGQRMRFTLNRPMSVDGPSRSEEVRKDGKITEGVCERDRRPEALGRPVERREKMSPSYNIKDMAAMFEQKSQNTG